MAGFNRPGWWMLACAGLLWVTGCVGYRLGPTNELAAGQKTIAILPVANRTLQPRLADALAIQLRKQLQHDGTYRLVTRGDADLLLTAAILRFDRGEVTFDPNDVLSVRDYRLSITAQTTLRDRSTGVVLLDQPVTGFTLMRVGTDLSSAERQALPLLAGDLARNITDLLVDGKW